MRKTLGSCNVSTSLRSRAERIALEPPLPAHAARPVRESDPTNQDTIIAPGKHRSTKSTAAREAVNGSNDRAKTSVRVAISGNFNFGNGVRGTCSCNTLKSFSRSTVTFCSSCTSVASDFNVSIRSVRSRLSWATRTAVRMILTKSFGDTSDTTRCTFSNAASVGGTSWEDSQSTTIFVCLETRCKSWAVFETSTTSSIKSSSTASTTCSTQRIPARVALGTISI